MIVAHSLRWGFALAAPPVKPSEKFELVHVPGLIDGVQYCRIELAQRELFVVFLAGAAPGDARAHALAAHFPHAAFAVVFHDSIDRRVRSHSESRRAPPRRPSRSRSTTAG